MTATERTIWLPHDIDTARPGYRQAQRYYPELVSRADAGEDWDAVWKDVTEQMGQERVKEGRDE